MKKTVFTILMAVVAVSALASCYGSFPLARNLHKWNGSFGNKVGKEAVFFAFVIIPVYQVAALADVLVLNSIEFWTDKTLMAESTHKDKNGREITIKRVSKDLMTISVKSPGGSIDEFEIRKLNENEAMLTRNGGEVVKVVAMDDEGISVTDKDGTVKVGNEKIDFLYEGIKFGGYEKVMPKLISMN